MMVNDQCFKLLRQIHEKVAAPRDDGTVVTTNSTQRWP